MSATSNNTSNVMTFNLAAFACTQASAQAGATCMHQRKYLAMVMHLSSVELLPLSPVRILQ